MSAATHSKTARVFLDFLSQLAKRFIVVVVVVAACLVGSLPVRAVELAFGPDLAAAEWSVYTPRKKAPATFSVERDGSLTVEADTAVAFLYRFVPKDLAESRTLSWQWRVDHDFAGTDLSKPGADDRPIAVHVYFADEEIGPMGRLTRGLGRLFGAPVSGRAITYVWGGHVAPRTMIPNPFMKDGEGVFVICQPSGDGDSDWRSEVMDLEQDYLAAFGDVPAAVSTIAVSSDTDDTRAYALARLRNLRLEP